LQLNPQRVIIYLSVVFVVDLFTWADYV